jgi:large conductance mechanosensitive channel
MGFIKEFKDFAMKGNLIDMAIAFVMGAAFTKVVTGFIDGMVMPVVGKITAGVDFKALRYILDEAKYDAAGKETAAEISIKYGQFITILIDFILVAFFMFLVVKGVNRMKKKEAEKPAPPAEPTKEEVLLTEIRDLLSKK